MAYRSHDHHAVYGIAVILVGVVLHYGWSLFPPDKQAIVWNVSGSATRLLMLGVLCWIAWSRYVTLPALWFVAEEAMVIGCNAAYYINPWPRIPGESMCSSLISFDLGKVSAVAWLMLTLYLWKTCKT